MAATDGSQQVLINEVRMPFRDVIEGHPRQCLAAAQQGVRIYREGTKLGLRGGAGAELQ